MVVKPPVGGGGGRVAAPVEREEEAAGGHQLSPEMVGLQATGGGRNGMAAWRVDIS